MTVTELIESLQIMIFNRPDVAGMDVILDDDPTFCVSDVNVTLGDDCQTEVVNIA